MPFGLIIDLGVLFKRAFIPYRLNSSIKFYYDGGLFGEFRSTKAILLISYFGLVAFYKLVLLNKSSVADFFLKCVSDYYCYWLRLD